MIPTTEQLDKIINLFNDECYGIYGHFLIYREVRPAMRAQIINILTDPALIQDAEVETVPHHNS